MNFIELSQHRHSCRSYSRQPVSRALLDQVLESARLAPSACNKQPWLFAVVDDETSRAAITAAYPRQWIATAPAYIIACGIPSEAWHRPCDAKDHTDVDVSIATEHICLAAAEAGLGTCWVCNFDVDTLRQGLRIPQGIEPIAIIPIGYPEGDVPRAAKTRKPLDEIVRWGGF